MSDRLNSFNLKNSKGEVFEIGQAVICVGTKYSGPACGVSDNMRNNVGDVLILSSFVDRVRKIVRFKNNSWCWHLDDFASDGEKLKEMLTVADMPKALIKWSVLDHKKYLRHHTNQYYLFKPTKDNPNPTWADIVDSTPKYEVVYDKYGNYQRKQVKKGTKLVPAAYTNVHSCLGGFMSTFDNFRHSFKSPPTHSIQQMQFPKGDARRRAGMSKLPKGYQNPTVAQWKEYIDHMVRGGLLPKYIDSDAIFADKKAEYFHFTLDMRKISKERWYFYASIIRNLGEYPRLVHGINGLLKDYPKMHPLTALCMLSALYCTRTHAAVETIGLFTVMNKYVLAEVKDLSLYITRVAKFLSGSAGFKPLHKETKGFVMWRIFKLFRAQGQNGGGKVIRVRPPKASYADVNSLLTYNPFTREVL